MSLTLYDVAHYVSWNGYTEDTKRYVETCKEAWNNDEFWFPNMLKLKYGPLQKTRLQIICENAHSFYYDSSSLYNKYYGRSHFNPIINPIKRVKELLARGPKPIIHDVKDLKGDSPLTVSCKGGGEHRIEIIEALLAAGANVNQETSCGMTPLYLAAYNGHTKITVCHFIKTSPTILIVINQEFGRVV